MMQGPEVPVAHVKHASSPVYSPILIVVVVRVVASSSHRALPTPQSFASTSSYREQRFTNGIIQGPAVLSAHVRQASSPVYSPKLIVVVVAVVVVVVHVWNPCGHSSVTTSAKRAQMFTPGNLHGPDVSLTQPKHASSSI